MKQSSIEWLIDTMHRSAGLDQNQIDAIFEQALEMHKEEINEAYANGSNDRLKNRINDEYYNETFNTKEK